MACLPKEGGQLTLIFFDVSSVRKFWKRLGCFNEGFVCEEIRS